MDCGFTFKDRYTICDLIKIMEILRLKCPWDREQTHESIRKNFIEETYEVVEAIDTSDTDLLKEELGDVLLQVVFHSQMEKEKGTFDFDDVAHGICEKLILRHPHIFGHVVADNTDEVLKNWEAIKKAEKGIESTTHSMKSIPKVLPALMRSYKVQKKAALVGFDWDNVEDAMEKIYEELEELKEAYKDKDNDHIADELGDLLFAVVNVARFFKVEPELALTATVEKFIKRFEYIETHSNRPLEEMTLSEMDDLWNEAKKIKL